MSTYGYALGEEAVQTFTSLPPRQREKLLRVFDGMTRYPNAPGGYQEPGSSGRPYQVRLIDNLLLTWWVDHAVQEVRIIRIERIE